jgi:ATP-dependent DNA helicase RecG
MVAILHFLRWRAVVCKPEYAVYKYIAFPVAGSVAKESYLSVSKKPVAEPKSAAKRAGTRAGTREKKAGTDRDAAPKKTLSPAQQALFSLSLNSWRDDRSGGGHSLWPALISHSLRPPRN